MISVLDARMLPVDAAARERIERCTDPDVLNGWIARDATAAALDEVFGPTGDAE